MVPSDTDVLEVISIPCNNPLKSFILGYKPDSKKITKITGYGVHHLELDAKGILVCVPTANFSDYRSTTYLMF